MNGSGEIVPLDDATIETIADLNSQQRACEFAKQAVLNCFAKQHGLSGNGWLLAPNGKELVKPLPQTAVDIPYQGERDNA